jgi:RsiW-degrading membrane proteinase PrsW (M82 family)
MEPPSTPEKKPDESARADESGPIASRVSEHVTRLAGVDRIDGFDPAEFFAEVFKRHGRDEVENYFTVGTPATTPSLDAVDTSWPRPWVFFRTFLGSLAVYFLFVQAWREFGNLNLIPGLIIVGSFAVPISALIFFFEVNARKNVSLYQVVRLVFLGGILSLILSLFFFEVSGALNLNWLGASLAGLVEEPGKLLAVLWIGNQVRYRYTLNGLLFGAAVGAGFAAFESAGYALYAGLSSSDPDAMMDSIMIRGMLSPFAHIVWTAMSAAALWRVKQGRPFRFEMVKDPRFLRIFGIAVGMHMLWNSPVYLPFYLKYLAIGAVAWIIVVALIQDGLRQLREEKSAFSSPA